MKRVLLKIQITTSLHFALSLSSPPSSSIRFLVYYIGGFRHFRLSWLRMNGMRTMQTAKLISFIVLFEIFSVTHIDTVHSTPFDQMMLNEWGFLFAFCSEESILLSFSSHCLSLLLSLSLSLHFFSLFSLHFIEMAPF